ncbi:UNVERIFIED_CONTAM: hypothetical protein NCL1_16855 [Trichonephila clavipes]
MVKLEDVETRKTDPRSILKPLISILRENIITMSNHQDDRILYEPWQRRERGPQGVKSDYLMFFWVGYKNLKSNFRNPCSFSR